MYHSLFSRIFAGLLAAFSCTLLLAADPPPVALTADVGGNTEGLLRRAAAGQSVEGVKDPIRLDAGGFLFGNDEPSFFAEAYAAADLDAINLATTDFRRGLAFTRDLVKGAGLPVTSANLRDENDRLLFASFRVVERGGHKVAVIGVTEPPAALPYLPHLQDQLAGIRIADPARAVAEVLPAAEEAADKIILLVYGSARTVEVLRTAFGERVSLIGVGGAQPRNPAGLTFEGPGPVALSSKPHGTHVTVFGPGMDHPHRIPVTGDLAADPAVEAVLEKEEQKKREQLKAMKPLRPASLPAAGTAVRVLGTDANQGLGLTVFEWKTEDSRQGTAASEKSRFLILDVAIANQLQLRLSQGLAYAEAVQVASLRNKAFLVMNRRRVIRHPEQASSFEGHLPDSFVISVPGNAAEGQLVFEIPGEGIDELDLVLYHDEFPALTVKLVGDADAEEDEGAPVDQGENEVLALEVHSVKKVPSPLEGHQRLLLDVRGRSKMSRETDSAAVDPGVAIEENEKVDHAIPLEYAYFSDLMVLEIPEERFISPIVEESEFPALPAFLPDRMAGGRLVVDVPDEFAGHALRLKAWFPTMTLAGDGAGVPVTPGPIELEVQEGRTLRNPTPQVSFQDGNLTLDLLEIEAVPELAGQQAPTAHQWVRVLLRLENTGDEAGLMPMSERFGLRSGEERISFETSGPVLSPFHPPSSFYLPAGEGRVFEVIFTVPLEWRAAHFDYRGITSNPGQLIEFDTPGLIADQDPVEFETDSDSRETARKPPGGAGAARQGGAFELTRYSGPEEVPPMEFTPSVYSNTLESTPAESRIELGVTGENERVKITAGHAFVFTQNEEGELPEDKRMVGVHLRIERREDHADPVSILYLKEHLFAVSRLAKLQFLFSDSALKTQIPHRFELKDGEETVDGLALFKVPSADLSHFELHWLDEAFGNIELPLIPLKQGRMESPEAHFTARNRIAELDVAGIELRESFGDQMVENGRWLVMDLRGRSVRQTPETAGGGGGVGTRLSWRNWMLRSQLIVNGDQVFSLNRHQADIEEPFLMLPGRGTGGEIAFGIPDEVLASAESIEFVAGFGAYAKPGERVSTPKPIRIQLRGERPEISLPEASQAVVEDVDFDLHLARTERVKEFMGSTTRAGEWLVADLFVRAKAAQGVFFAPNDRVQLVNGKNESVQLQAVVWGGDPSPSSRSSAQWIAPGDVRRVQMAWAPNNPRELHRIRYAGMLHYQQFSLGDAGDQDVDPQMDPAANRLISERGLQVLYPDREPKGIAGVDLEPEQVNNAIDRGQAYLWKEIQEVVADRGKVSHMYYIYPMLYALVNTDLQVGNAEFDGLLREFLDRVRPDEQTIYENGLLAMILRAYGDPDYADLLRQTVHYFVEAQGENGTWSYRAETPDRFFVREEPVESADGLLIAGGENPETAAERLKEPVCRTQSFTLGSEGDNSCTQFAVLGLWSAQRAGLKVDSDVWKRVLRSASHFQNLGNTDSFGGYAYGSGGKSYGSMSAAVLCTTAIALRQLDPDLKVSEHLRIRNALGWLAENFTVELNPNKKRYNYYYLYSLERVGQILGTEFIGNHEWYPMGARYLVDTQKNDGSWPGAAGETNAQLTTSYALLFLTRATPKMDEDLTPDPDDPGILLTRLKRPDVRNRVYLILDASGSMRDQVKGRTKFDVARQALGDMVKALPKGTEVALRVYGHRLLAIEKGAAEDTELVSGWTTLDVSAFQKTLQELSPKGKTPLTLSLKQAAGDVTSRRNDGQTLVVLLTDGGESTRGADPVEAAKAFAEKERVRFFVLGFDINREDWTRQLQDMAAAADGVYRPVEDATLLTRELISVVNPPAPAFSFTGDDGELMESGTFEDGEFSLKPGKYTLTLDPGADELTQTVWIRPGGTTRIQYTINPARRPLPVETSGEEQPESDASRPSFCTQCGNKLKPDAKFCTSCGESVR